MLHTLPHEKELLRQLREGNEIAFGEIYQLYSARLFGKLMRLVKVESVAEEILQDVFIKIWEYRTSIDTEKSFSAFLFKVADNKVYDFYRKVARDRRMQAEFILASTSNYRMLEEFISEEEKLALLQNAINKLPPQRQQVFRLCKINGKSYKEVSEQLGISVSTISDHIVKATKAVREQLRHHPGLVSLLLLLNMV